MLNTKSFKRRETVSANSFKRRETDDIIRVSSQLLLLYSIIFYRYTVLGSTTKTDPNERRFGLCDELVFIIYLYFNISDRIFLGFFISTFTAIPITDCRVYIVKIFMVYSCWCILIPIVTASTRSYF